MWDKRSPDMTWDVKASGSTISVYSLNVDGMTITLEDQIGNVLGTVSSSAWMTDVALTVPGLTTGEVYKVRVNGGLHYRMHWDGIDWATPCLGQQGVGPDGALGFQSDAALGFDARWGHLPSQFSHTTWYFNVAESEHLSVSLEHVTGERAKQFAFISPSGVETVVDPDGMPGAGHGHWQARGGNYYASPDPLSPYWDEYTAPTAEAGLWGFKLYAIDGEPHPYAFHYILDRTDDGADQNAYIYSGSILDPTIPEPLSAVGLACAVAGLGGYLRRRRRVKA